MTDLLDRLKNAFADRYTIEREIGSGGMATVYHARDLKHERQVAMKVLRCHPAHGRPVPAPRSLEACDQHG